MYQLREIETRYVTYDNSESNSLSRGTCLHVQSTAEEGRDCCLYLPAPQNLGRCSEWLTTWLLLLLPKLDWKCSHRRLVFVMFCFEFEGLQIKFSNWKFSIWFYCVRLTFFSPSSAGLKASMVLISLYDSIMSWNNLTTPIMNEQTQCGGRQVAALTDWL